MTRIIAFGIMCLAFVVQTAPAQVENLMLNSSAEEDEILTDWTGWGTWNPAEGEGSTAEFDDTESIDGSRSMRIDPIGTVDWHFIVVNMVVPLEVGKTYTASFWAKAEEDRTMSVQWKASDNSVTWANTLFELTTEWAEYFFTSEAQNADGKQEFLCAGNEATIWLDFGLVYEGEYVSGILPSGAVFNPRAKDPSPSDGAQDVIRDSMLVWKSGPSAATHDVYFGSTFEDVNSQTVPLSGAQDANAFDPGRLEFDQTYYWRVDEVNGAPDYAVSQGDVWSFTVEPYSIQIPSSSIAVTASSFSNEFSLPVHTIDGSGLGVDNTHAVSSETMWFTAAVDLDPWIQYEFDDVYKLDIIKVWNSNSAAEIAIGWGVKDVQIAYSVDGETWDVLADADQFNRAPGLPTYNQYDEIAFNGAAAKYVRLNIASNWGGMLMSYSLSEVQFTMIPTVARSPQPASDSVDVTPDAMVSWRAGRDADQHLITIGTDANAVALGTASSITTQTNELALDALDLNLDQTYYWRVDEVNDAESTSIWEGPVWSFSTPRMRSVDDFEGYGNLSPDRPFQVWLDGYGYSADEFFPTEYPGNGTGAGVGHDIWSLSSPYYDGDIMETDRTHAGSDQSMPFYYTNTGGVASQIDRRWSTPQDWSANGIQTLVLYFYGAQGNTGQLYLKINGTKISYDGDAANLTKARWNPWHVELGSLAVSSVNQLSIGVEGTGASGMVLLDDIGLYRSAPELVTPVAPSAEGLVAHWKLDDGAGTTALDSAGNHHGTIEGIVQWITGPLGGALKFDALNTYVDCGTGGALDITDVITLSVWVNPMDAGNGEHNPYVGKGDHAYAIKHAAGNSFEFYIYENGWHTVNAPVTNGFNDNWYHLAGTYDGAQVKLYVNGELGATVDYEGAIASSADSVNLGRNSEVTDRLFEGSMDDARIYHRVLSEAEILYLSNQ